MKKNIFISGKALTQARVDAGLIQDDLAQKLGVSRATVNNWEKKQSVKIDERTLNLLENILKVNSGVLTNVSHETNTELELYKQLAIERMERIEELKEQVQSLKKELAECRSGK